MDVVVAGVVKGGVKCRYLWGLAVFREIVIGLVCRIFLADCDAVIFRRL